MAASKICDYSAVVEYGYSPVFCPSISQSIGWNYNVNGSFCSTNVNSEPVIFYLLSCFDLNFIYKFEFIVTNYIEGELDVIINGNNVLTINSPGLHSVVLIGLSGTVELKVQPNGFTGCFTGQIFKTSTQTQDFPLLIGISINGEYQELDTPVSFDPNLTDLQDYFSSLSDYTVNVFNSSSGLYTIIHFSQTEDVIDYIVINPNGNNDDEFIINFSQFNCPSYNYSKWECCRSNLTEQLYKVEKYLLNGNCILDKIKYLSIGIDILKRWETNCLTDEQIKLIEDNLNSLCCSPCPPDNQVVKYINNPPPTVNQCTSVEPIILRGKGKVIDGAICSGNSVTLYVDTSVYYYGYIYKWEESIDDGQTWVDANGIQLYPNIPVFYTSPITTPIRYRLVVSCSYSNDSPYISNEISYVILSNPEITASATNLPTCADGVISLTVTDVGIGASYYWVGPNGFTSTQREPMVSASVYGAGNYTVLVTTSSGCQSQATVIVQDSDIIPIPEINYSVTEDDGSGNGEIYIEILNSANALFDWGINNDYGPSTTITGLTAGTYTIQVVSDEGCLLIVNIDVPSL